MDNIAFTQNPPEPQAPELRQIKKRHRVWHAMRKTAGAALMLIGLSTTCLAAMYCAVMGYGLWLLGDIPVTDGPGHDGRSIETPIVVHAASEEEGVRAEYRWLDAHGDCDVTFHKLVTQGDRAYDELTAYCPERREVWFDVTEFYGHR